MTPETLTLEPHPPVPNNPRLPVLVWRGALGARPSAEAAERMFAANGWPAAWRDGIFDCHHYHSNTHEALAVVAGEARVTLGGPGGPEVTLRAGDVAVLPAGTGHRRKDAGPGLLVVGAYPKGCAPDLWRDAPDAAARARIAALPVPPRDPVEGGPLARLWEAG